MIFKVAFDTGRVKRFKLKPPPAEPFIGFRVVIEEEGNTGIIVGAEQGEEGEECTHRYPDGLPLILPEHIKALKEIADFYRIPYVTLLFQLIPSAFILYKDTFIYPKREEGVDRKTKEVLDYIKKRKRYTYDSAVKKFGKGLIGELLEKGILEKKEEWVSRQEPSRLVKLKVSLKEALRKVKSKRAKLLLLHIAGEGGAEEKDIISKGFSRRTLNSLIDRGLLEYSLREVVSEGLNIKINPVRYSGGDKKENFLLWGDFSYVKDFLLLKKDELKGSVLMVSTQTDILESLKDESIVVFSSKESFENFYKNWFLSHEGKKIIGGSFNASLVPLRDLSLIAVLDDTLPSVKLPKDPHIDIRNLCFLISKEFNSSFCIASPVISVESFYLLKKKTIRKDIKMLGNQEAHIIKRHPKEIVSREIISLLADKSSSKLIIAHKKGYSYMYCEVCQLLAQCPKCEKFLTYFRSKDITLCTSCGFKSPENTCPECGRKLKETGAGIEKVMEVIEERFGIREDIHYTTFPLWHKKYDYVILIDAENILSVPDYKADEQFYIFLWRSLTSAKKSLFVQTLFPENKAIKSIKRKDPFIFLEEELKRREAFNLPPFTRMITALFPDPKSVYMLRERIGEGTVDFRSVKTSQGIKVVININRKHRELLNSVLSLLRGEFRKFAKDIKIE